MDIQKIGIIGNGQLGSAIGEALTRGKIEVSYFDRDPARSNTSLEAIVSDCQILIMCLPSWEVNGIIKQLDKLGGDHSGLILSVSKGVEHGFVTMNQIMAERLPKNYAYGVLYGPMIAEEISRGRMANGIVGLSDEQWFAPLKTIFDKAKIILEYSQDIQAVSVCAVLKNVYAISFGMLEGLHLGLNAKGRLTVMVLKEMKQILGHFDADPAAAEGTAGMGDLIATGFNENSFNFRIGKSVVEGIAGEHIKSEGLFALQELGKIINVANYPVMKTIDNSLFHYGEPHELQLLLEKS